MISISERMKYIDVALIYDLWNEYATAVNNGDLDRLMSLCADDGIQLAPCAPPRVGKEQICEAMQPLFDRFITSKMTIHTEAVQIFGDRAYAYGTYTFEGILKKAEESMCYSGKFLDILAKQADGSWRIAIDCHNYDESYG
jgi:uncharacterized protein (TIGR02246 family)